MSCPTLLGLLRRIRSLWISIPGWLRIALPMGLAGLLLWYTTASGMARALTHAEMASLLETTVTVSGITLGLVFMFLVGKLFASQTKFDDLLTTLSGKEGKVLDYLQLCELSGSSYELWHKMPSPMPARYEDVRSEEGIRQHPYIGAVALCKAVRDLGDTWLRLADSRSKRATTRPIISAEMLERVRHLSNEVWYALDRRKGSLDAYFKAFNVTTLVMDMPFVERMASRVFVSEGGERFTSLDYWRELTGHMEAYCDDLLRLHNELYDLSPRRLFRGLRLGPILLVVSGLLLPLALLLWRSTSTAWLIGGYLSGFLLAYSLIHLLVAVRRLANADTYAESFHDAAAPER